MSRNIRGISSERLDEAEAKCKANRCRLLIRVEAAQHPQEMQRALRARARARQRSQFNLAAHFMLIRNMRYITHFTRLIITLNLAGTALPYYFRQTSLDSAPPARQDAVPFGRVARDTAAG